MRMEGFSQVFCCWVCPCDISSAELTGKGMEKKEKQRFSLRSKTGDLEQHGIKQEKKKPQGEQCSFFFLILCLNLQASGV